MSEHDKPVTPAEMAAALLALAECRGEARDDAIADAVHLGRRLAASPPNAYRVATLGEWRQSPTVVPWVIDGKIATTAGFVWPGMHGEVQWEAHEPWHGDAFAAGTIHACSDAAEQARAACMAALLAYCNGGTP